MEFKGVCKNVDKIVVSDPSYSDDVWCRYERNDIKGKDWLVHGFVDDYSEDFDDVTVVGKEFYVALSAPGEHLELHKDGTFAHYTHTNVKEFKIGMDTACVGFGINAHAEALKLSKDEWHPSCCLETLTDGEFGTVYEGVSNGKVRFVVLSGFLDNDTGYSQKDILAYLVSSLEIELERSLNVDELISDALKTAANETVISEDKTNKSLDSDREDIDLN